MEEDLEYLKRDLERFCKKYNVTLRVETYANGRYSDGTIENPRVAITLQRS